MEYIGAIYKISEVLYKRLFNDIWDPQKKTY